MVVLIDRMLCVLWCVWLAQADFRCRWVLTVQVPQRRRGGERGQGVRCSRRGSAMGSSGGRLGASRRRGFHGERAYSMRFEQSIRLDSCSGLCARCSFKEGLA